MKKLITCKSSKTDRAVLEQKFEEVNFIATIFIVQKQTEPTGDMEMQCNCNALPPSRKILLTQPIDDVLLDTENPLLDISESNVLADNISYFGRGS